jgi:hypothetical protein
MGLGLLEDYGLPFSVCLVLEMEWNLANNGPVGNGQASGLRGIPQRNFKPSPPLGQTISRLPFFKTLLSPSMASLPQSQVC